MSGQRRHQSPRKGLPEPEAARAALRAALAGRGYTVVGGSASGGAWIKAPAAGGLWSGTVFVRGPDWDGAAALRADLSEALRHLADAAQQEAPPPSAEE